MQKTCCHSVSRQHNRGSAPTTITPVPPLIPEVQTSVSQTPFQVCPVPMIAVIRASNPSVRMGISGVWNGFFMTASA